MAVGQPAETKNLRISGSKWEKICAVEELDLLIILLVVVLLVVFVLYSMSKANSEFREKRKIRADAYSEYILREQPHERFIGLSKSEIFENLDAKITEFNKAEKRVRGVQLLVMVVIAVTLYSLGFAEESWTPLAIGSFVGFSIAHFLTEQWIKKLEARYEAEGYLPDKLRIELL